MYGFFGYHRLSRADAEDLTQATFERAVRAHPRFDPARASARTWLLAIARNLLIDHHRRQRLRRHAMLDGDLEEVLVGSEPRLEDGLGLSPPLEAALKVLSAREREVIALRFGGDLRGPAIAELLELSLANVQQIASRALRKLRAELEPTDPRAQRPEEAVAAAA